MKVILYMAITANGKIAKENDEVFFVSKNSWKIFDVISKKAGNIIMGRRTYEISLADKTFPYSERLNVVMAKKPVKNKWGERAIFTYLAPKEVLNMLEKKGFKTAFIGGGSKINSAFLKEKLVNEIYLDVEPVFIGKGIPLLAESSFETTLELIDTKKLSSNEVQLHYRVKK